MAAEEEVRLGSNLAGTDCVNKVVDYGSKGTLAGSGTVYKQSCC